MVGVESSED
jgi:hypothetical protein